MEDHPVRVSFVAGSVGEWRIERVLSVRGRGFPAAPRLQRIEAASFLDPQEATWVLTGVRSNERYVERAERARLAALQDDLGRPSSTCAALIPIKKSKSWWALAQDERRAIFEASSRHIQMGLMYLPAIARRLYHCRDLGGPFDFLPWFEFSRSDRNAFDELLDRLRVTEEWSYVEREVDIRLTRD